MLRADVDAYLERARIQPGSVSAPSRDSSLRARFAAHEPFARDVDGYVPGLAEVDRLHDLGWINADIAQALGMHLSNVSRRRVNGFSAEQVDELRRLIGQLSVWGIHSTFR